MPLPIEFKLTVAAIALAAFALPVTPTRAQPVKACQDLGGTSPSHQRNVCLLTTKPAPFDVVFTGRFEKNADWPLPQPVLKVTNKSGGPVTINIMDVYAYDKAGNQLEFTFPTWKEKFLAGSFLKLALAPGESKERFLSLISKVLHPDMDTLQGEIIQWTTPDATFGTLRFVREIEKAQKEARPKGGWK